MSYFEMHLTVECPHCGDESHEHAEFNMYEGYQSGVDSGYYKVDCFECNKEFWFKARCSFETEATEILKKKPKDLK